MRLFCVAFALAVSISLAMALLAMNALAQSGVICFPIETEIVSLGEKNARAYATRSLDRNIEERETVLKSTGFEVTRVARKDLECAPFPNLLGADEWSCTGTARVCARAAP